MAEASCLIVSVQKGKRGRKETRIACRYSHRVIAPETILTLMYNRLAPGHLFPVFLVMRSRESIVTDQALYCHYELLLLLPLLLPHEFCVGKPERMIPGNSAFNSRINFYG